MKVVNEEYAAIHSNIIVLLTNDNFTGKSGTSATFYR